MAAEPAKSIKMSEKYHKPMMSAIMQMVIIHSFRPFNGNPPIKYQSKSSPKFSRRFCRFPDKQTNFICTRHRDGQAS